MRWLALAAIPCLALSQSCFAGTADLWGGASLDYKLALSYGVGVRTKNPDNALINGPVDSFQSFLLPVLPAGQPAQIFRFTHSGLPTTINFDDGDRNFRAGSLINNRATALAELQFHWGNYGLVASGDAFYDQVYHHPNDNDSPDTNNTDLPHTHWTPAARYYDGQRFRLLDAYLYGDWNFGDVGIDLRVGQQLVAWGQSLFFSGVALAQSRADATKAFIPGAEVKSILLPTNQVSLRLSLTNELSLLGYYKLAFRASEIFPEGDYFSPSDAIGPGATFVYGSANPVYGGPGSCPGLLSNLHIGNTPVAVVPASVENYICGQLLGFAGQATAAPRTINTLRGPDLRPSDGGQYGAGLEYQITRRTNLAFYYLRYDDANPSVQLNFGYPDFTTQPVAVTTQVINQIVPVTYDVKYFDGIHLYSGAFSTVIGPFNVAGELNYRDGIAMAAETAISDVISPVFVRGRLAQAQVSAIYVTNPHLFYDDLAFTTEIGAVHATGMDAVPETPGITQIGNGDTLFYSRNAWAFNTLTIPTRHGVFNGWDMSTPLSFGMLVKGNPALPGAFGAFYGQGDTRLGVSVNFQYLSNLEIGVGYNFFFGNPNENIGASSLKANPYMDRDYATFHITYNL